MSSVFSVISALLSVNSCTGGADLPQQPTLGKSKYFWIRRFAIRLRAQTLRTLTWSLCVIRSSVARRTKIPGNLVNQLHWPGIPIR